MIRSLDPDLVFELVRDEVGHFSARCLNAGIRAEGDDLNELHDNLTAAVAAYFPGQSPPPAESIHLVMFPAG